MYSLLTVLLIAPSIILLISYFNTARTEGQDLVNRIRADDLKSFHNSLLQDLSRSLKISTERALIYATKLVIETGEPFSNPSGRLSEMVLNGSLDGNDVPSLSGSDGSICNTVRCWKDKYKNVAESVGYELSVDVISVSIEPYDSDNLNSSAEINITLKDPGTNSKIEHIVTQSSKVSIEEYIEEYDVICISETDQGLILEPGPCPPQQAP